MNKLVAGLILVAMSCGATQAAEVPGQNEAVVENFKALQQTVAELKAGLVSNQKALKDLSDKAAKLAGPAPVESKKTSIREDSLAAPSQPANFQ